MNSVLVAFALTSFIVAGTSAYPGYNENHEPDYYKFDYSVDDYHTGDIKQQYEVRHGHTVKGTYSLAEPDGTYRIVQYEADPHNGFNAVVKRLGKAQHSEQYQHGDDVLNSKIKPHLSDAESPIGTTHWGS